MPSRLMRLRREGIYRPVFTIKVVQSGGIPALSGTTKAVTTLNSNVKTGSLVIAAVANESSDGRTVTSLTGGGVTWNTIQSSTFQGFVALYYGLNSVGGSKTITATYSGSITDPHELSILEVSGAAATGALDKSQLTTVTATTAWNVASLTPSVGAELFVGLVGAARSVSSGPSNGYTALPMGGSNQRWGYYISTDAVAHSTGWVGSSSNQYTGIAACFQRLI